MLGIGKKHLLEKIQSSRVNVGVFLAFKSDVHFFVFLVDFFVFAALKYSLSGEKNMEDDSSREEIAFWLDVLTLIEFNDFRSDVAGSSTPEEQVFFDVYVGSKAEIDDDR